MFSLLNQKDQSMLHTIRIFVLGVCACTVIPLSALEITPDRIDVSEELTAVASQFELLPDTSERLSDNEAMKILADFFIAGPDKELGSFVSRIKRLSAGAAGVATGIGSLCAGYFGSREVLKSYATTYWCTTAADANAAAANLYTVVENVEGAANEGIFRKTSLWGEAKRFTDTLRVQNRAIAFAPREMGAFEFGTKGLMLAFLGYLCGKWTCKKVTRWIKSQVYFDALMLFLSDNENLSLIPAAEVELTNLLHKAQVLLSKPNGEVELRNIALGVVSTIRRYIKGHASKEAQELVEMLALDGQLKED